MWSAAATVFALARRSRVRGVASRAFASLPRALTNHSKPSCNGAPSLLAGSNAAAVLFGVGDLRFRPWALPATPPHGHVRIAMQSLGICGERTRLWRCIASRCIQVTRTSYAGSDVHYVQHGRIADFILQAPMVLGHEASGEVVQLGGGVTSLRVGARVALEPGVPCWQNKLARQVCSLCAFAVRTILAALMTCAFCLL